MKLISQARSQGRNLIVGVAGTVATGLALAGAPSATSTFSDALTAATSNVGTFAAGLVTLAAVSVAFMIAMKFVKKLPRAA